jgi:hypothetical protein
MEGNKMASVIWGLAAKLKRRTGELVDTVQQKVEAKGGVEAIVKEAATSVGKGIGVAAKAVDGFGREISDDLSYDPKIDTRSMYEKGRVDPNKTAAFGEKVAVKGTAVVKGIVGRVRQGVAYAAEQINEHDIAPQERQITIAGTTYTSMARTKSDLAANVRFMLYANRVIPGVTEGKTGVMNMLAQYAAKSPYDVVKATEQAKLAMTPALEYLMPKK